MRFFILRASFFFVLFGVLPRTVAAQVRVIKLEAQKHLLSVAPHVYVLEDKENQWTIEEVSDAALANAFERNEGNNVSFGFTPSTCWLRLHVLNPNLNVQDWILEISKYNLPTVDFYYQAPGQKEWRVLRGGSSVPVAQRVEAIRALVFPLPIHSSEVHTFYLRIRSEGIALNFIPTIYREDVFHARNTKEEFFYGIFFGIIFFMTLSNLFLYVATREQAYLYYVLANLMACAVNAHVSGHLYEYVFASFPAPALHYRAYAFMSYAALIFGALFTIAFLNLRRESFWLYKAYRLLLGLLFLLVILAFVLPYHHTVIILNGISALALAFAFVCGAHLWLKGMVVARFFFFAYLLFFTGLLLITFKNFGILEDVFLTRHGLELGALFEMLMLSMALADRQRIYMVESKIAQEAQLRLQQNYNQELEREVSKRLGELNKANKLLEAQKEVLQKSNQSKEKLISVIAHDFKSPLNSLKGAIALLKMGGLSAEEIQQLALMLEGRVENTLDFVNNLLYWVKSQMQGIEVRPEHLVIAPVLEQIAGLYQPQIQQKGIALECRLADETLWADAEMFRLIVRNLLSNAIKFTPSGGRISIWAELQEAYCCLHIQDTGLGLSPQKISSLLEEAQVASQEGTWQEEGTGLGLFLVRDFIRKNQGVFQIQSTEGQGSTFSCSFLREAPLD